MKTPLCLTLAAMIWAAFNLSAVTLYVSLESTNPVVPFATWATAATNIQDAVNAAAAGDEVVVNDGMYFGHIQVPYLKPLNLRSVNGSQVTIINGGGTNRCVFLTFGASLTGFTLTNGVSFFDGGGVYGLSTNSYLTNCTLNGNSAFTGGGVSGCTLYNCTLNRNTAGRLGGAAIFTTLYNCTLNGNSAGRNFATGYGGGAEGSTLYDCTLTTNSASGNGGAAHICILYNCTLISNSAGYT